MSCCISGVTNQWISAVYAQRARHAAVDCRGAALALDLDAVVELCIVTGDDERAVTNDLFDIDD